MKPVVCAVIGIVCSATLVNATQDGGDVNQGLTEPARGGGSNNLVVTERILHTWTPGGADAAARFGVRAVDVGDLRTYDGRNVSEPVFSADCEHVAFVRKDSGAYAVAIGSRLDGVLPKSHFT